MKKFTHILCLLFCFVTISAQALPRLQLHPGDRVAFVGGVFMEREADYGDIEAMLTLSAGTNAVSFRNFGWGGDTVESHIAPKVPARPKYVGNLFSYLEAYKPTVVFVSYGMMESFRGEAALPEFTDNYRRFLDRLSDISKPRVVLVSPFQHEQLGGHFPDPTEHNRLLKKYVEATRTIAEARGLNFVNLFEDLEVAPKSRRLLTSNGVHLNGEGYKQAALAIQKQLKLTPEKVSGSNFEVLRSAIQHKNKQWWFHYRPMNAEYVFPGGTRYQNELGGIKHPMFAEIEEFAARTAHEDQLIGMLVGHIKAGEKLKPVARRTLETTSPKTPDPEAERKTFQVADGFEVELFAADPKITKPVQMAFDQKGRLWVATTTLYPQIKPGEEPTDSIIILEDSDGDGRAEKTTTFAEGLVIPTGVLPYRDGAFVFDDTTLLFLRDTNGDGRADEREVVLSGFGTEDSHHKGHVLRWGPEGRLHFNVGVFLHNNIETAHGLTSLSGYWQPGIFAYDPLTGKLDTHLANSVPPNPWGHYWNKWGFDFHIDSSGNQGSNLILPTANRTSSALPVPGGEGKLAGGEILSGRHLPENWRGNLISAPFKENRVARWEFSDDGSGYGMKQAGSLIVSTDSAFRPVDERMGPDGAIYISDWYNPLIGHMQHHFRDPGRDFTHGRIWRVTAKGRPLVERPKIDGASVKQLFELLKAPEDYTRLQARRELSERSVKEVIPALKKWVQKLDAAKSESDHHRLEALWVCQSLKVVEPTLLRTVLQSKDANARAAATGLLRDWHKDISDALPLLAKLVRDEHPRVRLQAVIALSYIQDLRSIDLATSVLDLPMDRTLEQALKNTVMALKPSWEPALAGDQLLFNGDQKRLSFVVKNAAMEADPKVLIHLLRADQVAPENIEKTITSIVNNGSQADLEKLNAQQFAPEVRVYILSGLTRAARERKIVLSAEAQEKLLPLLSDKNEKIRTEALRLAGAWKVGKSRKELEAVVQDKNSSASLRQAAIDGLVHLGGDASTKLLTRLLKEEKDTIARQSLLGAFVELDIAVAAKSTADLLKKTSGKEEIGLFFQPFLKRNNGADALAKAITEQGIHADNAKLGLRFVQTAGRQDKPLLDALSNAAGLEKEQKELSREELQKLAGEVLAKGDAARGEHVFRRPELSCFQCHAIGSAGGMLGPDLSAIGSGSALDYLIESLLQPNKIIKDGFEAVEVVTHDDEYVLGIKVRENARETVLKDAVRNEIVISASIIKEKKNRTVSLMPAGLTTGLTHAEFLDLCRFLSELGKPGAFANNPAPIVRRWQVVSPAPETFDAAAENTLSWSPVYSTVSGVLPLEELSQTGSVSKVLLRTQVDVTTAGKVQFSINSTEGVTLYVDGKKMELQKATTLDLSQGIHSLVFELDLKHRKDGVRVEMDQSPASTGRFQLVTGR